ncbi:unnamed protein product [Lota lota]
MDEMDCSLSLPGSVCIQLSWAPENLYIERQAPITHTSRGASIGAPSSSPGCPSGEQSPERSELLQKGGAAGSWEPESEGGSAWIPTSLPCQSETVFPPN